LFSGLIKLLSEGSTSSLFSNKRFVYEDTAKEGWQISTKVVLGTKKKSPPIRYAATSLIAPSPDKIPGQKL